MKKIVTKREVLPYLKARLSKDDVLAFMDARSYLMLESHPDVNKVLVAKRLEEYTGGCEKRLDRFREIYSDLSQTIFTLTQPGKRRGDGISYTVTGDTSVLNYLTNTPDLVDKLAA